MNQIIVNAKTNLFKKKIYIIQFCMFFILISSFIIYLLFEFYSNNNVKKLSYFTNKSYSITKLYSNSNNFIANSNNILIIGTIEIPAISVTYPILSEYNDELLKLSVCKFYGPHINKPGNLCIVGHNFNNNDFFSNLYLLNINDIINLYDLNNNKISYSVYKKYEVFPNNLDYLYRNTYSKKEITLITCNNLNRKTFNYTSKRSK